LIYIRKILDRPAFPQTIPCPYPTGSESVTFGHGTAAGSENRDSGWVADMILSDINTATAGVAKQFGICTP
jgi:hypothetical protein